LKILTTLTGPSCAGKSTLEAMLVERGCLKAVSTTTRTPRAGEKEGVDYYFVDKSEFKRLQVQGAFIESVQFGEHYYGVSVMELKRLWAKGDHVILVCEPIGAKQIRAWAANRPDVYLRQVFVDNPTSVIRDRFLRRFYEDMRDAAALGTRGATAKVLDSYSKRLTIMQTTEKGWIAEAYGTPIGTLYDIIIERFDESNATVIAHDIAHCIPA